MCRPPHRRLIGTGEGPPHASRVTSTKCGALDNHAMWVRVGVGAILLVAGLAFSVVLSRPPAGAAAGSSATDTTAPSSTVSTTTSTTTTTTTTLSTTSSTTTAAPTSTVTTTRRRTTATPAARPRVRPRPARPRMRPRHALCLAVGAVEALIPRHAPLVVAPRTRHQRYLVYPSDGSIATVLSLNLTTSRCSGSIAIHALSLFAGAVTARLVGLDAGGGHIHGYVLRRLRVRGRRVANRARRIRLGRWALVTLRSDRSALLIRVLKARAGFAAGTVVRVAFAMLRPANVGARRVLFVHANTLKLFGAARPNHRRHARRPRSRPLKMTPPLGHCRYVFPVGGPASFGDSYGAFRADVSGDWHHGDDIFAPLGTPVVAVAAGTLNRVGWERIGGWRLWIRDRSRNEFYYAHLSGYSPLALRSKRVKAGEVLGFVGNTGDAFTTAPHLHFEVHPHELLYLQYDGAVDPTTYLDHWRHLARFPAPKPMLPPLPGGDAGHEARFVFGELRATLGLKRNGPRQLPHIRLPDLDHAVRGLQAAPERRASSSLPLPLLWVVSAFALSACVAVIAVRRQRS
jgi:murein DD-endopeptidase MepM/ murein hydrolase activator NlpD